MPRPRNTFTLLLPVTLPIEASACDNRVGRISPAAANRLLFNALTYANE